MTGQFLVGATIMARQAGAIEHRPITEIGDDHRFEHQSLVISAIVQAAFAIESEIAETVTHGPGSHLGSDRQDAAARDFLGPLAALIDKQSAAVERFQVVLHVLGRPVFERGAHPWQRAALLMRLRNEIVHY